MEKIICTKKKQIPKFEKFKNKFENLNMFFAFTPIFVENGICNCTLWQNAIKIQYIYDERRCSLLFKKK